MQEQKLMLGVIDYVTDKPKLLDITIFSKIKEINIDLLIGFVKEALPDIKGFLFAIRDTEATRNFFKSIDGKESLTEEELTYFYTNSYRTTIDGKRLIDGRMVFDNMDARGIPLDIQLMQLDILTKSNFAIDWCRFIDRALECKWLVYQIHDRINYALKESDVFNQEYIDGVMWCFMVYICQKVEKVEKFEKHLTIKK